MADCRAWLGLDPDRDANGTTQFLLENPSVDDIRAAISEAGNYVLAQRDKPLWNGGGLSIWYSGHGTPGSGAWALNGGDLGGRDLVELLGPLAQVAGGDLGLELALDSCHSGAFFAHLLEEEQDAPFTARDMYISSLPEEVSWELEELGHGVMAFTLLNRGNAHVDQRRLARAVRDRDDAYVRFASQAFVPNPVTYLTEGDQTSCELVSRHRVGSRCCESCSSFGLR